MYRVLSMGHAGIATYIRSAQAHMPHSTSPAAKLNLPVRRISDVAQLMTGINALESLIFGCKSHGSLPGVNASKNHSYRQPKNSISWSQIRDLIFEVLCLIAGIRIE